MRNPQLIPATLLALTLLASARVPAAATPEAGKCPLKQLAQLNLRVDDSAVLVPVTMENREVWMVLDMAASQTTIAQSAVTELKLSTETLPSKDPFFYFGKTPATQLALPPPLVLGGVRFKKEKFLVNPVSQASVSVDGRPVLGALGMDALWSYDFELDLASRKLTFYSQTHCASGQVVYWASYFVRLPMDLGDLGTIHMAAELDGRKIEATLSTRSRITSLTRDAARQLFGFDEHSPDMEIERDVTGRTSAVFRAMELTSGALTVKDVKIRLIPSNKGCRLATPEGADGVASYEGCFGVSPLVLGRGLIERLRLYFATAEKAIYYTEQDGQREVIALR
jgi:hypothetical protein